MADIVNVRDLTIQAQLPRLIPVPLPGNVTVPTTNVTGLPDYYSATKQIVLKATTQVFKTMLVGGTSPSNIIITADILNILGTVVWTVIDGAVNYTTGINTLTIQSTGLTSQSARIKASVTSGGIVYEDTITIVKVSQGSGDVVGLLTNEMASVPSIEDGVVLSYYNSGGQFRVFSSEVEVTGTAVTYSVISSTALNISIDSSGTFTVDSLTLDAGSAILQASYNGVNVQKSYSVKKIAQITNGKNGVRGTVNIAVSTTGNAWSDQVAVAGLSSAGYGEPQSRDIVTLYNTSSNYSESKFYNGSIWLTLDAYINGNLLVDGSVFAEKVDTRNLTIKDAAGNVILSANEKLDGKTHIKDATIGLAVIDTATIGKLSALSAELGTVEVGEGGNLRSGKTDFNTGEGFWLGRDGGDIKFSIGDSEAYLKWSPNNGLELKQRSFDIVLTNTLPNVVSNGQQIYSGTVVAEVTGGVAPYIYNWSTTFQSFPNPGNSNFELYSGQGDTTTRYSGGATDNNIDYQIHLVVTDSRGLSMSIGTSGIIKHGNPIE